MLHGGGAPQKFVFPKIVRSYKWWQFLNTGVPSPKDIYPELDGPARRRLDDRLGEPVAGLLYCPRRAVRGSVAAGQLRPDSDSKRQIHGLRFPFAVATAQD